MKFHNPNHIKRLSLFPDTSYQPFIRFWHTGGYTEYHKNSYLVHRKTGNSYLFRSVVPLDLQPLLGTRQFQLSLGCGTLS